MEMDTDLKFAEKYNWWSKDKWTISKEIKLSYIMSRGTIYEVYFIFKSFDLEDLEHWYTHIKDDNFALKPRRKAFLNTLFEEKKDNFL